MAAPQIRVFVDFESDTAFETNPLFLDSATKGLLGTNRLGSGTLPIDVTDIVRRISIRRGRNRITSKFEAGSADVTLYDANGDWNPTNVNGAYYPNLLPLKQIIITATFNNTDFYLFSGYITEYKTGFFPGNDDNSSVTLRCFDAFRLLAGASITTVSGTSAGQLTGARVNAILNQISWPDSLRNISDGDTTLQNDPGTTRNVLDALQVVENSELGGVFLDGQGKVNFKSRTQTIQAPSTAAYTFADDGTAINYQNAVFNFDDTTLLNSVSVTRLGGTAQTASDADSITAYFLRSGTREGILVQTDTESLNQARSILATRKDPEPRIDSIDLNALSDNTLLQEAAVGVEILDGVIIKKTMPGNTTFTQESVVIGIHHDITPNMFKTTFFTSEPLISGFVLDSAIDGLLDTDVLAY